ncbi:hypothetical protein [Pseudomonas putida]|uniref:hypothetical protein n=1 Tax=Pseudomonas putida TaxID=303 RepID=UPI00235CAFA2|nr:hypothetical protein [Pseudomonas putida]GLO24429.1 hypothetical protein PPUJ21368_22570 [Pseudomonas putida]HDS0969182.1 hypothetical protein [Pseudomonas putida]
MPTENRSSTIEQHDHIEGIIDMVSVPREVIEFAAGLKWHGYKSGTDQKDDQLQALKKLRTILAAPAPQPHPDPIAWMVGTAIWWAKEEAERDAAEVGLPVVGLGPMTGSSVPAVSIPDGYCLMPRRLTAENGAKALMLGEFKLEVTRECPECLELDEPAEGCEICDGEGEYAQRHTIPWDQIKFIYSEAVKGLALKPNTAR